MIVAFKMTAQISSTYHISMIINWKGGEIYSKYFETPEVPENKNRSQTKSCVLHFNECV